MQIDTSHHALPVQCSCLACATSESCCAWESITKATKATKAADPVSLL